MESIRKTPKLMASYRMSEQSTNYIRLHAQKLSKFYKKKVAQADVIEACVEIVTIDQLKRYFNKFL